MASYETIKKLAIDEKINDVDGIVEKIKVFIQKNGRGDFHVPEILLPAIEAKLDILGIPCYNIAESTLALNKTYAGLYASEQNR